MLRSPARGGYSARQRARASSLGALWVCCTPSKVVAMKPESWGKKWWVVVFIGPIVVGIVGLAASRLWPEGKSTPHNGDTVAGDKITTGPQVGDNVGGDKVTGDKVTGDKVAGDKVGHTGDNNFNITIQPTDAPPPDSKPPFDPKLRIAAPPPAKKPLVDRSGDPSPKPPKNDAAVSEPINVITLAERPRDRQVFNERFTETNSPGVSLEGNATPRATALATSMSGTGTLGPVSIDTASVLTPNCGSVMIDRATSEIVHIPPPAPHPELTCVLQATRSGYAPREWTVTVSADPGEE